MKTLFTVAAIAAAFALGSDARADGLHANPFGGPTWGQAGGVFRAHPLPAFQAAPWYLYFPYNAHFQTPSPMYNAPWYGPPATGYGGLVNPYFPNPNYGQPHGYGYAQPPVMAAPAPAQTLPPVTAPTAPPILK